MSDPLLDVSDLRVSFATGSRAHPPVRAVDGVSFQLRRGEVLAIVGESGSGKSVCAMTLMGLTRGPSTTVSGSAQLAGEELIGASEACLRRLRGRRMAMVFQDPQSSLNPVHRVGDQIAEQIRAHEPLVSKQQALRRAGELMERVGIPRAQERVRAYPHELSGGMRQRVTIAMALSLGAPLLLADEPTTALDVTVQAQILAELKQLREQEDLGIALITHDFAVVADLADRIAVMQEGRIVEQGTAAEIFDAPAELYTRRLLDALVPTPRHTHAHAAEGAPVLAVDGVRVEYRAHGRRSQPVQALAGVSLSVNRRETLAIVGESGCGKTTLLRSIAGLIKPTEGTIRFDGQLGMVFQDPQASLNPRRRVGKTLERSVRLAARPSDGRGADADIKSRTSRLLERVGLDPALASRFPHELSGGQRQRIGIARALAGSPQLVLLDEPVSSLDASLRRGVIELLDELQAELGCAYVVVSHDLGAVEAAADRIAVMHAGEIVELGSAADVLERPQHPYTRELLAARPLLPDRVPSTAWADREN
ncbi:MAG TPA: ABC transporter ATP-binding protein [Solirubrobacteraceae bacterium]|nr:ABC transporter ATP-binding protein [Solirubrobacteraceae bacterium]